MKPVEPILIQNLFSELHDHLISLLWGLAEADWNRPTICAPWSVKDLAAHLLDGDVRRLSLQRDKFTPPQPESPITDYSTLVGYLNQLNHDWVVAAQRLSPRLLTELLDLIGGQTAQFFQTLDPEEPALFPVAWAGEVSSLNWFDLAREYTERWLHQQQIREATDRPGLTERRYLYPVLDTFMRAMPHTYREVEASAGTGAVVSISGEAGGEWSLLRQEEGWRLFYGRAAAPAAQVSLSQDTAWRLFTKGLSREEARRQVKLEGEERLGAGLLSLLAIMA